MIAPIVPTVYQMLIWYPLSWHALIGLSSAVTNIGGCSCGSTASMLASAGTRTVAGNRTLRSLLSASIRKAGPGLQRQYSPYDTLVESSLKYPVILPPLSPRERRHDSYRPRLLGT